MSDAILKPTWILDAHELLKCTGCIFIQANIVRFFDNVLQLLNVALFFSFIWK